MGKIWGITFIAAAALSLAAAAPTDINWDAAGPAVVERATTACSKVTAAVQNNTSEDAATVRRIASEYCPR